MRQYKQGETVVLTGYFTDKHNAAADPSVSKKVRIADPTNTLVALSGSATEDDLVTDGSTGYWKYAYDLAADAMLGKWDFELIGTDGDGNDVSMGEGAFEVIKRIGT